MKLIVLLWGILVIISISFSCAPKAMPAAPLKENSSAVAAPIVKIGWESEWDRVLASARKEGKVVVIGGSTAAGMKLHATKLFKDKFGLDLEAVSGRGGDVVGKIMTERRAGLFVNDVYLSGQQSIFLYLKPAGALDPVEPVLILPEVIEPKGWLDGKMEWADKDPKDRFVLNWGGSVDNPVAINTRAIKEGEIKSFQDLLNPKWKGKISFNDPTIPGSGNKGFVGLLYNKTVDESFFRNLVKNQDIALVRDQHLQIQWLVKEKYPIALWASWGRLQEYLEEGVPVIAAVLKEGTESRAGGAGLALVNRAPHPNAAKVFINWFLSREGQIINQKASQKQSRRIDIPVEGLVPTEVRKPGVKYLTNPSDFEDFVVGGLDEVYMSLAREIFAPLLR